MKSQYDLSNYPLWTALVTPFDADNQVDYDTLTTLVVEQQNAGNGLLILGSTGEGLALDQAEQRAIVEHVCSLNPSVPIMVAVGGFNLTEQLAWLAFCEALPVDAYLLGSPLYAKPGLIGQTQWFDALLNATELTLYALQRTGSKCRRSCQPQVLKNLAAPRQPYGR